MNLFTETKQQASNEGDSDASSNGFKSEATQEEFVKRNEEK